MKFTCRRCDLSRNKNYTPGKGDRRSGLFVLGISPELDRDGELLNIILRHSGIKREEIYITDVCKCKPLNNESLTNEQIYSCTSHYLEREIYKCDPLVVIALGHTAISYLTGIKSVSQARAKKFIILSDYEFVIIPTWHPSYLIRNGLVVDEVKQSIHDFKMAKKALEIKSR